MTPAPQELCSEYPVFTQHLANFNELRELAFPSPHSILLLAANFQTIDSKEIADTAEALIARGNAYLCAWGESCAKAEDAWDSAVARSDSKNAFGYHTVSTSHEDETLEEAAWYALNCAFADKRIAESCSVVLITIDHPEWQNIIDNISEDPAGFNKRSLEDAGADESNADDALPPGLN